MLPQVVGEYRVVADPELRFSPSGVAVCSLRVVASSQRKTEAGEWVDDKTFWTKVTGFKQQAENMAESFVKGNLVLITGKIQTEEWEDKEGNKRQSTAILVDNIGHATRWDASKTLKTERSSGSGSRSTSGGDPWTSSKDTPAQDNAPPF